MIYKDNKQIKALFRQRLAASGYTMQQCATAAGLSKQAFNNRFLRQDISLTELSRLAACCGLSVDIDIIPATHDGSGSAADRKPGNNATSANQDSSGKA